MRKKSCCIITMILALSLLIACFAGCGNSSSSSSSEEATTSVSEDDYESSEEESAEGPEEEELEEEPEEEPPVEEESTEGESVSAPSNEFYTEHIGVVDYSLPLFEEEYTVSMFWVLLNGMGGAATVYKDDLPFWQRVQERLGVDIDFLQVSETVCQEQYSLMLASGDLTDLIQESNCGEMGANSVYPGGYDKAIEDDFYMDITDMLEEYAPNYYEYIHESEDLFRDVSTDSGKIYSFYMIYDQPQGVREGPIVRRDYLEETGLDTPTTTEEWMEVFAAMKSNGVKYPWGASSSGDINGGMFGNAFGTTAEHAFKIDLATETIVYDGTSDEMRDFLEYFSEAFQAGYISPDYAYTQMFDTSLQVAGDVALYGGMDEDLVDFTESYGLDLIAVPFAHTADTDAPKMYSYAYSKQRISSGKDIVITTACEEPEKAMKFLDWFYSTEGAAACVFGFEEGESYEVVDGVRQWLPLMTGMNEDKIEYEKYYATDEGIGIQIVNKKNPVARDYVIEAKSIWLSKDDSKALYSTVPSLSFTAEESEEVTALESDISTYVSTELSKFMIGTTEINDETWDAYCQQVEDMGISQLLDYYNTAYDRYLQR